MSLNKYIIPLFLGMTTSLSAQEVNYESVFGKSLTEEVVPIDFFINQRKVGIINAKLKGDQLIAIDRESLLNLTYSTLSIEINQKLKKLTHQWIKLSETNLKLNYHPDKMAVVAKITAYDLAPKEHLFQENEQLRKKAIAPSDFGGAFTLRAEQFWASERLGGDFFVGSSDNFINFHEFVLENQTSYQTNAEKRWYRGDTRLVKDFQDSMIRSQLGDVNYQVIGFQTLRPIGGVGISRNFSLNPYRAAYPEIEKEFVIETKSKVTYYVNGRMVKSEYLAPGKYSIRDIPLVNGINSVVVEIEDDLGRKEVLTFQQSTSINLLSKNESKFDLSVGYPFEDVNGKREYEKKDLLVSSFYQYGLNDTLTTAGYVQNFQKFTLLGSEAIFATHIGNFGLGVARGENDIHSGDVYSFNYNLSLIRPRWFAAHNLNLRHEFRNKEFVQTWDSVPGRIKSLTSLYYSLPLMDSLTLGLGANYGKKNKNALNDRYGFEGSLTANFFKDINTTFYFSTSKDEMNQRNDMTYLMVYISLPDKNQYITGYADLKNNTQRITHTKDNLNQLNTFKSNVSLENNDSGQLGDVDVAYNANLADLGIHATGLNAKNSKNAGRFSARMHSSLVFAKNDESFAWSFSRPVQTSFAIFTPDENLKDQKISVKSTSPYSEGLSDFRGQTVFVNLLPYQYREVNLDPSYLAIGRTLEQENFVLIPSYKSAHLINIRSDGKIILDGVLKINKNPAALTSGKIVDSEGNENLFFTNREGRFFIEGLKAGSYQLEVFDGPTSKLTIPEQAEGIYQIGILEVQDD